MTQIEVELHEDVISILNKIKNINDTGIELLLPDGAVILENVIDLKLIKSQIEDMGKTVHFLTNDIQGQNLIKNLNDDYAQEEIMEETETEYLEPVVINKNKRKMPKLKIKAPKLPIVAILIALLVLGYIGISILIKLPNANAKIVVNSQPLTKSITVNVGTGNSTDKDKKQLVGDNLDVAIVDTLTTDTTGEKLIGEKASGKITVINKTDLEKKFGDGTKVIYEKDDKEYVFLLKDDVTVPAQTPDPDDPIIVTYGSAEVEVEAEKIGSKYNIDKGEDLKIKDQSSSEYSAITKEDFSGGKEETIKTVAQADLDKLKTDLTKKITDESSQQVEKSLKPGQKLITGSEELTISKQEYDKLLGDEAEKVTLTITASVKALVYNTKDLDKLMDEVVKEFIPEGFILSNKERTVNVEILGNTGTATLNSKSADIQVTLKTFVVPDITEEALFDQIKGKSVTETQKILGSIRNVKSYEFNLSPKIPFFSKVPTDINRVHITIERE